MNIVFIQRYSNDLTSSNGSYRRSSTKIQRRIYRSKVITLFLTLKFNTPNFIWHCDGYDKLKPFGIAIHGCIDG